MKYIIFAVCVFGVVDIATSNLLSEYDFSLDPDCPPPGNQSESTYLPYYYDCSKFYECSDGKKVLMSCPENLYWNIKLKICDFLRNVDCSYVWTSTAGPPTQPPTRPSTQPSTRPPTPPPTPKPIPGVDCRGVPDGTYFADPYDRSKFYECVKGVPVLFSCPAGYVWEESRLQCVSYQPSSPPTPTPAPEPTTTSPVPGVNCTGVPDWTYFADPFDRTKLYECVKGNAVHLSCLPGLYWDQKRLKCVPIIPPTPGVDCTGVPDGTYFENPFDRTKFYECVKEVAVLFSCPAGQVWDESRLQCVADLPPTPSPTTTPKPVPGVVCTGVPDGTYFANPFDRTKFYECVKGVAVHFSCPAEKVWNQKGLQCV
nr:uncharacterized protein LOC111506196 isoform X1 [Leptinotarsa decemlineata]